MVATTLASLCIFWCQRHCPLCAFRCPRLCASTSSYVVPYQGVARGDRRIGRPGAHLCGTNQSFLSPTEERQRALLPLPLSSVKFLCAPRQAVLLRTEVDWRPFSKSLPAGKTFGSRTPISITSPVREQWPVTSTKNTARWQRLTGLPSCRPTRCYGV